MPDSSTPDPTSFLPQEDAETDSEPGPTILALNSGSSSLKFGLYRIGSSRTTVLLSGEATSIGEGGGKFDAEGTSGNASASETGLLPTQQEAVIRIGTLLSKCKVPAPVAIGHRIVHGGPKLRQHCLIDDAVMRELEAATAFAPLHAPAALSVIRFAKEHFPGRPQVACFDTTFHAALPEVARVLPIAKRLQSEGIQRYGFHGLSCESIVRQLDDDLPDRLIIAHLGNGASVTAVKGGKSLDTSMGLTPSGGVIMGTRSGDLDPGLLIYLMREKHFDAAMLEELVDHHSGLLGISGVGGDMRRLHEAASSNADARLAVEMFCYSVRKQIAAMIAALDGVDTIVFTGGIGENDEKVRGSICSGLSWMGIKVDQIRNKAAGDPINDPASRCSVRVITSREDEQIARHTQSLIQRRSGSIGQASGLSEADRSDQAIAEGALQALFQSTLLRRERIRLVVSQGQVTLSGTVASDCERTGAERVASKVDGVTGVTNLVTVQPEEWTETVFRGTSAAYGRDAMSGDLPGRIEALLERDVEIAGTEIRVAARGGEVVLTGLVRSWRERDSVERLAWSAPGVTQIEDHLDVGEIIVRPA